MNPEEGLAIRKGSMGGLDMRDQLRQVFITRLGEVYLVSHPHGVPFLAVAGIQIIWGVDHLPCR